ncbi:hypothetical protein [Roseicella aerolata]|uniref:Uncharacterized protein n=1 Tax=Roseicella aerolata TaxID=2883479 RepID=A0A9X1IIZ6_9PROT|nr:hypothetical protein [Roseicella aerolata]MCB4825525.1 hypothetical protein [Roseicella aerolata]
MQHLRRLLRTILSSGAGAVVLTVGSEWFVKLAEERGLYDEPSSHLERAMNWLASWTTLSSFDFVAGLVLGLTAGAWLDYLLRLRERRATAVKEPKSGQAAPISRGTYLGRVHIDAGRLASDFLLEFSFIAFNATGAPIRLKGVQGRIAYAKASDTAESNWETLPPPVLREDNLTSFAPYTEFMVIVSQRVPGALIPDMDHALSAGERVMFVLEGLTVSLAGAEEAEPARMPMWERVTCERVGRVTTVLPIALLRARIGS